MSIYDRKISVMEWMGVTQRLELLEERVFKKKKPYLTLNQQILALKQLGLLDLIFQLKTKNTESKYTLLAALLNGDESNTKKGYYELTSNDEDIVNSKNYKALQNLFEHCGLTMEAEKAEKIYHELEEADNKKRL